MFLRTIALADVIITTNVYNLILNNLKKLVLAAINTRKNIFPYFHGLDRYKSNSRR